MDRMGDDPSNDDDGKGHSNEETASIPENDTRTPFEVLHVTESFDSVAREQMRSLKNMNGYVIILYHSDLLRLARSISMYCWMETFSQTFVLFCSAFRHTFHVYMPPCF